MDGSTDNLTPAEVAKKTFGSRLRGADPTEVSAYLETVAAQLRTAETDRDAWKAEVDRLREEVTALQETIVEEQAKPDEAALTEQLGQEAGRVLTEARSAAADRLLEAEAEAADIIAAAEEIHAERSRAADAEVERLRATALSEERTRLEAADDEAGTIRDRAREEAAAIRADAGVDQQAADADAARIIREAELTRRRILEDLARRRSAARRQIEQLRAGRERLLASHEVVRRALEEISEELNISMSEARAAAETAGHTVSESTIEEIEAEIETAKLAGLLDTGPLPVVRSKRTPTPSTDDAHSAPATTERAAEPSAEVVESDDAPDDDAAPVVESAAESSNDSGETEASRPTVDPVAAEAESPPATKPDIARAAEATNGDDGDGPLADVVSLTAARQDVDTDRHPANRRPPKAREPEPEPVVEGLGLVPDAPTEEDEAAVDSDSSVVELNMDEPVGAEDLPVPEAAPVDEPVEVMSDEPEVDEVEASELEDAADAEPVAEAEEVEGAEESEATEEVAHVETAEEALEETAVDSDEESARADSLFARMRKTQDAALVSGETEPDAADAPTEPADGAAGAPDPHRLVDDVGRKLKRVLADEQSDVLSSLRSGTGGTGLDDLLGTEAEHRVRYWSVTEAVLGVSIGSSSVAEAEVTRMVDGIRHRVGQCLVDADADPDAAVDRLRSVYREVKTQRISEHAQIICGAVEDLNAS